MATTARTNKAELNKTLETAPVPTIWACNSTESMDPALMRRFDVVLEIPIPPESVRRRICRKALTAPCQNTSLTAARPAKNCHPALPPERPA